MARRSARGRASAAASSATRSPGYVTTTCTRTRSSTKRSGCLAASPSWSGTLRRGDAVLTGAALDQVATGLLDGDELASLRACQQIVAGDIPYGLTTALSLLLRRSGLCLAVTLEHLADNLEVARRPDLARLRQLADDAHRADGTPAHQVLAAADDADGRDVGSPPTLPNPRLDALCARVLTGGVFACAYVPYADFDGRTDDGDEDTERFDTACAKVEGSLRCSTGSSRTCSSCPLTWRR